MHAASRRTKAAEGYWRRRRVGASYTITVGTGRPALRELSSMSLPSLRFTASLAALGAATAVLSAPAAPAKADEGMWTFDNFPIATVNEKYGTNIDQAWLDRVRNAAVRLQGCSASLVSGEGLVLTNHHCVVSCVQDLSTAQNDYVKNGWMPGSPRKRRSAPARRPKS